MLFILLMGICFIANLKAQTKIGDTNIEIFDFNENNNYRDILFRTEVLDSKFSGLKKISAEVPSYVFNDVDFGEDQLKTEEVPYLISFNVEYENGNKTKVEAFYENGMKWYQVYFNKTGRNGVMNQWHMNGNKKSSFVCEDGVMLNSADTNWYKNGNVHYITQVIETKKVSRSWYKSGVLAQETMGDTASESYHEKSYLPTGEMWLEANFNDGRQTLKKYFKNGNYFQKGDMINMPLIKVGKWQMWFENGQIELESYYDEKNPNIKIGTWNYYDVTGKLIKEESYRLNELIKTTEF